MKGNVIVGQSGGPTAAINSSLAGVYRTAIDRGAKKVYGMIHGIEGLLSENYVDLSEHIRNDLDVELLKRTPAAYLGSCRYKLPDIHKDMEIYKKIASVIRTNELDALYNELQEKGNGDIAKMKVMINNSIKNGWKGFYEPKGANATAAYNSIVQQIKPQKLDDNLEEDMYELATDENGNLLQF